MTDALLQANQNAAANLSSAVADAETRADTRIVRELDGLKEGTLPLALFNDLWRTDWMLQRLSASPPRRIKTSGVGRLNTIRNSPRNFPVSKWPPGAFDPNADPDVLDASTHPRHVLSRSVLRPDKSKPEFGWLKFDSSVRGHVKNGIADFFPMKTGQATLQFSENKPSSERLERPIEVSCDDDYSSKYPKPNTAVLYSMQGLQALSYGDPIVACDR
ncbi:unnamed protein product [Zymoseptoria tritici ST99CH_3D7]|uniref:Uncharacterized protein n=1 Tax=Zymoseptoria tritici (strain ST99CH_3D7) TaxID=1276538 RepID=A0A1X7RDH9_ZYMT9|nr:unnamed protein product [Zymoseptoria tritici ST99CH_3D7]